MGRKTPRVVVSTDDQLKIEIKDLQNRFEITVFNWELRVETLRDNLTKIMNAYDTSADRLRHMAMEALLDDSEPH